MFMTNSTPEEFQKLKHLAYQVEHFLDKNRERLRLYEDALLKISPHRVMILDGNLDEEEGALLLYGTLPFVKEDEARTDVIKELWAKKDCEACKGVVYRHAMGTGNLKPKYMLIGEAPGVSDGKRPLERVMGYGPTSIFLRRALYHNRLLLRSWFTNILKCSLPNNTKTSDDQFMACSTHLLKEIELLQPQKIFLLGKNVQKYVHNSKHFNQYRDIINSIVHPSYCAYKGIDYKVYASYFTRS